MTFDDEYNVQDGAVVIWWSSAYVYVMLRTMTMDGIDQVTVRQDRRQVESMVATLTRWLDDPTSRD